MSPFEPGRIKREILWVYGVTLVVTGGLSWLQGSVGWLRGYLLAIAAGLFLYLPLEVLQRKGIDPADFGIHRRRLLQSLRHALLISLIVFPVYWVGFHVWQTQWLGNRAAPSEARFDHWPVEIQDAPKVRKLEDGEVRVFAVNDEFWLSWHLPAGQKFVGQVRSNQRLTEIVGRIESGPDFILYEGGSDGRVGFRAPGDWVEFTINAGGDRLPPERLRLGTALVRADTNPHRVDRSYWWIINLVLIQFLLVALPEEVFYRGYLQTRLDQVFAGETRVLGVSVNLKSLVLTSALFAVGHYVTIPSAHRLAVFFPSLLFGWMRRATGGIVAPLVFHALCNLFVEFAQQFYAR